MASWERTCDFVDFLPGLGDFSEGLDDGGHLCQQDIMPELVDTDDGDNDCWNRWGNHDGEASEDDDWEFGADDDFDEGWAEIPQWPDEEAAAPEAMMDNDAPPHLAPMPCEDGNFEEGGAQVTAT